ncbi:MAG: hypothetical protein KDK38_06500 [Leptospiraceae bacterium]|nr:hypothetical protein [Leptospiraceae bacterium]
MQRVFPGRVLFWLVLSLTAFVSCVKLGEDVDEESCLPEILTSNITYTGQIQTIFSQNCGNCHGSSPANGASTSYHTLALIQANLQGSRSVYTRINLSPGATGLMPTTGKMDACTLARISRWESLGYPN